MVELNIFANILALSFTFLLTFGENCTKLISKNWQQLITFLCLEQPLTRLRFPKGSLEVFFPYQNSAELCTYVHNVPHAFFFLAELDMVNIFLSLNVGLLIFICFKEELISAFNEFGRFIGKSLKPITIHPNKFVLVFYHNRGPLIIDLIVVLAVRIFGLRLI